jgi:heme/copper-type cytochrome/quinol oxidase subunit 2
MRWCMCVIVCLQALANMRLQHVVTTPASNIKCTSLKYLAYKPGVNVETFYGHIRQNTSASQHNTAQRNTAHNNNTNILTIIIIIITIIIITIIKIIILIIIII